MKKVSHFIIIFIISHMIIIPVISNYFFCSTSTCLAAEKITPYKPQVRYSESRIELKTEPSGEIEPPKKRRLWPWIVGGVVVLGAVALGAGGGGGDDGGTSSSSDTVDVDVSW